MESEKDAIIAALRAQLVEKDAVIVRLQAALDASVFNLLSTAHKSSRSSMSIDGYSCTEYGGHIFW